MKAIFRTQKLKSRRTVSGCLRHNFRAIDTPNANPDRLMENEILRGANTAQAAMNQFNAALPEKIRKNAVLGVEVLCTASPEFFKNATETQQREFFNDSLEFVEKKFGRENVISSLVHKDETTPHLQTLIIPLVDGKLNARALMGGNKTVMSQMQTDYHKAVKKHGLERGQRQSKARHQTIKNFYTNIEQTQRTYQNNTTRLEIKNAHLSQGWKEKDAQISVLKEKLKNLENQKAEIQKRLIVAENKFKQRSGDTNEKRNQRGRSQYSRNNQTPSSTFGL